MTRSVARSSDQMREVSIERGFIRHAEGSVLISFGLTQVICTASIEKGVPSFLRGKGRGWITSEYGMLPRSTGERMDREAVKGKQSGRTQEIQRLIGRSLRAAVDLQTVGENTIKIDCDVIQADGGTRTASINGGFISLYLAIEKLKRNFNLQKPIIKNYIGAISVGIVDGKPLLDLNYEEDSKAEVDANFVICDNGEIAEIQVTGEEYFFKEEQYNQMFIVAKKGITEIIKQQKKVLS